MPDRDQFLHAVATGRLLRPDPAIPSVVDVALAMAEAAGGSVPATAHSRAIADHLHGARHLVLVVCDGLGVGLVDAMPRSSWMRTHLQRAIRAPFPATTPVALTSILTATPPAAHAILGWWTHLPRIAAPVTVLQHRRTQDGADLAEMEIGVDDLVTVPPLLSSTDLDTAFLLPQAIAETPYSRWMAGSTPRIGYRTHAEAVDSILQRVRDADRPTFTYLYTPVPDHPAHDRGTAGAALAFAMHDLDDELARLDTGLANLDTPSRVVVTADHGHLEINDDARLELDADDPLVSCLRAPPSGDLRTQWWHLLPGARDDFVERFHARFGEHFLLLETETVIALGLLGAPTVSDEARMRMGDYLSLARGAATLRYEGFPGRQGYLAMRSTHSGLTPQEVEVPLILGGHAQDARW